MSKNLNEPAFPVTSFEGRDFVGLTLRDYFASAVMAQLVTNHPHYSRAIKAKGAEAWIKEQAQHAYGAADAMLAERVK